MIGPGITKAIDEAKEIWRRRGSKARNRLSRRQRRRQSEVIQERLWELGPLRDARVLAGYMAKEGELDIGDLLRRWKLRGGELCLPRVVGEGEMEFVRVERWEQLEPGAFGIEEPRGEAVDEDKIDVFLVPGLSFDRRGVRVGFGGGYYDRVLAEARGERVGVGFGVQMAEESLPTEPHDCRMDWVVTDEETVQVVEFEGPCQPDEGL